jgi:hypothetical protein
MEGEWKVEGSVRGIASEIEQKKFTSRKYIILTEPQRHNRSKSKQQTSTIAGKESWSCGIVPFRRVGQLIHDKRGVARNVASQGRGGEHMLD